MRIDIVTSSMLAVALGAAPVMAADRPAAKTTAATPASALSLAKAGKLRAGAVSTKRSKLSGGALAGIAALAIGGAAVYLAVAAADDDDNNNAVSR